MSDDLLRYANSIVDFAQEQFMVPGEGGPELIRLQPHQVDILRHVLTPLSDGRFAYETVVYSAVKKSGKTTIGALVALWMALREHRAEVYCLANDFDQASGRVYAAVLYAVEHNPWLRSGASVTQRRITFDSTGSFIEALPSEYAGAAGSNPSCTVFDELWAYNSERARRLWDEMTPPPTRKSPIRLVVSYAGFEGESELLQGLYKRGTGGAPVDALASLPCYGVGRFFTYWDHEPRMPWQTAGYYVTQKEELRPNAYRRLHQNEWVSGESTFVDPAQWDALVLPGLRCPAPWHFDPLYVGVDLAVKHDSSAVVSVSPRDGLLYLGPYRIWRPAPTVALESVKEYLVELARQYAVKAIVCDPYQAQTMIQELSGSLPIREFPQTIPNMTQAGNTFFDTIKTGRLVVYQNTGDLREHVLNAVAKETERGVRLVKGATTRKIDAAIALAMAISEAVEHQGQGSSITSNRYGGSGDKKRGLHFVDEQGVTWTYSPVVNSRGRK